MDDFLWRALLGGLGVALVAGPFGCFVVWRRLAYFGDTLSHSALLGVALGFLLHLDLTLAVILTCMMLALLLFVLQQQHSLATDTLLGILAHSSLAIGLVVIAFMETLRIDLMAYLFGDILAISRLDLYWIYGGGILVLVALLALWKPLLTVTVNAELAQAEGVPVKRVELAFVLLMALVVAVMMKIVGLILVTALLLIPAAGARGLARTPERMAMVAAGIGCLSVAGGLWGSLQWDTPAGPSIVVAGTLLFCLTQLHSLLKPNSRSPRP